MLSGFNPYFTGSNSGSLKSARVWRVSYHVSILILLEVILEDGTPTNSLGLWFLVSILILLEVILEERSTLLWMLSLFSFNPYFTGSNSGRCLPLLSSVCAR